MGFIFLSVIFEKKKTSNIVLLHFKGGCVWWLKLITYFQSVFSHLLCQLQTPKNQSNFYAYVLNKQSFFYFQYINPHILSIFNINVWIYRFKVQNELQWTVWFKCVNVTPIKRCIILTYTPFIKMKRKQFFTIFEEFMGQLLPHVHAMYCLTNHYLKTSKSLYHC